MSGGDIQLGKCEICGVYGPLETAYFSYPIKCECHAPTHFAFVRHCSNCTAVEPVETKITIKTEVLKKLINVDEVKTVLNMKPLSSEGKLTMANAMKVLSDQLREDQTPGSYCYSWQSNLACVIMDNSDVEHDQANKIAIKFLNLLMRK